MIKSINTTTTTAAAKRWAEGYMTMSPAKSRHRISSAEDGDAGQGRRQPGRNGLSAGRVGGEAMTTMDGFALSGAGTET